jgi:hypothetical protein
MSRFAHTIAALQINALPRSPNARSRNAKKRERKQAVIVRSSKPSDVPRRAAPICSSLPGSGASMCSPTGCR